MATAINNQAIDPTKGAKFPITVSEQLLRDERSRKRQRISIQCNRRPKVSATTKTIIKPSQDDNSYNLSLSSVEKGEYTYNGVQHPSSTVALFYNPAEKSFTLDKLDAEFRFDLRSTPGQRDVSGTHPHLDNGVNNGDQHGEDLFGGGSDVEDTTPDPNNPYDYRHFLNKGNRSPSPLPSYAASPVQQHTFNSSPALPAMSPRQQNVRPPTSRPSRPKQRIQEKPRYLSPKPPQEEIDADNEDSDPNELVIDMGDSAPAASSRPWRSALSVLNEGGRGSAPFSLRSAASSMSPSIRGGSPSGDEKEIEPAQDEEENIADADGDADDDDVEEIDLGDNAVDSAPAPPEEAVTPGNGWDDDDDELEAELALALEEDQAKSDIEGAARGQSVNVANGESSEESEEE